MTTIHVAASRAYDVAIEHGLLSRLGSLAAGLLPGRRAAIISDDTVYPLYGGLAERSLHRRRISGRAFRIPPRRAA